MPKTIASFVVRLLTGLSCCLLLFGCALQSSLVDLEQEVNKTQKMQKELLLLREALEKMAQTLSEKPSAERVGGVAELLGEINKLKEQLRQMEGRLEQEERKVAESTQKLDDQAHQMDVLSERVDLLEQKMPASEDKEGRKMPPEKEGNRGGILSPTEAYHLAYNDYLRGNYDLAIISFRNYIDQYPRSTFVPEALYWIGQSHYNQGSYEEAVLLFEQIEEKYPNHEKAPNALLKSAFCYIELSKPDRARALLLKVVERFPQSNEAYRANDQLSSLAP